MSKQPISRLLGAVLGANLLAVTASAEPPGLRVPEYYETPPPAPQLAPPPARDFTPAAQRVSGQQRIGDNRLQESSAPLSGVSAQTLNQGRALYKNLLMARHAAERRDQIDMRLGLENARNIITSLYRPASLQALMRQSQIIREDLRAAGKPIDKELWLPLQAELENVRDTLPVEQYRQAGTALKQAQTAVGRNDKAAAGSALDTVESSLSQRFALIPLGKVRGDLQAVENALGPQPPYWHGVTEALDSALASIRWVSTVHANGWLRAYDSTFRAIDAAANPGLARRWLGITAQRLRGLPNAAELADRAAALARQKKPATQDMYHLIERIGQHLAAADKGS